MFANTRVSLLLYVSLLLPVASSAEPVPFKRAIELAIRNSTAMSAASADVNRLQALYQESRDQYIPQVYFGSGLAYSFGFPLGEASIFKVSSTSLLLNYAQREFIKAARIRLKISALLPGADTLGLRLSQLTGLPAKEFETISESIPRLPEVSQEEDLASRATAFSPAFKGAQELAAAKLFQARREHT